MKIRNTKPYHFSNYITTKDKVGNRIKKYDTENDFVINCYIYPASGKVEAMEYGLELKYIYKCLTDEPYEPKVENGRLVYVNYKGHYIAEGDGVSVFGKDVDFKIVSIRQHGHLVLELEMIH